MKKRIAVIGGNVSGVSCTYFLDKLSKIQGKNISIDVFEKNSELVSNKFKTFQYGQDIYDVGWRNYIDDKGILFHLVLELGLHRYLIKNTNLKKVLCDSKRELSYFPENMFYGFPLDNKELRYNLLFNFRERFEFLFKVYKKVDNLDIENITVEEFYKANIKDSVYDKLIEPLLSAYYGRSVSNQRFVTLMPELAFYSINEKLDKKLLELYNNKVSDYIMTGVKYRLKYSLKSIMTSLETSYSDDVFIEYNTEVRKIEKRENYYLLYTNNEIRKYDYVISTLNQESFYPLFEEDDKIKTFFKNKEYDSHIVVTFVYKKNDLEVDSEITEVVFDKNAGLYATNIEFVSNKWLDIKTKGIHIVKCYIKREDKIKKLFTKDDKHIIDILEKEIKNICDVYNKYEKVFVERYENSYPKLDLNYGKDIYNFINYTAKNYPRLYFIGASFKGIDLENTILEAREVAKKLLEKIK